MKEFIESELSNTHYQVFMARSRGESFRTMHKKLYVHGIDRYRASAYYKEVVNLIMPVLGGRALFVREIDSISNIFMTRANSERHGTARTFKFIGDIDFFMHEYNCIISVIPEGYEPCQL